jgi:hypothetical protein
MAGNVLPETRRRMRREDRRCSNRAALLVRRIGGGILHGSSGERRLRNMTTSTLTGTRPGHVTAARCDAEGAVREGHAASLIRDARVKAGQKAGNAS